MGNSEKGRRNFREGGFWVKKKGFLKLVLPISLIAAMVVAFFTGCLPGQPAAAPPPVTPPVTPGAPAAGGLTEDELTILGQLVNSNEPGVEYPIGPTINVGFCAPLSGPDAGWGIPGICGMNIFIDIVNKTGGLLVGGTRYPLKMYEFDDEAIPSKALQGVMKLVLENDVKFIAAVGGGCSDAVHPYLTEKKVVYSTLGVCDINPDRPYCIAGGDVALRLEMLRPLIVKNFLPGPDQLGRKLKYAITSQDDYIGRVYQAWEVGGAIAEGWEIVYDKHFSMETTDFAPVATAMMATNPDAISLGLCYPTFQTMLWEQLYLQGWEGPITQNYVDWEANLAKVPPEYAAKCLGIDSYPLMSDPWWGEPSWPHAFTRLWNARYGPGAPEDVHRHETGIDWDHVVDFTPWCWGAQTWGLTHQGEGFPSNDEIMQTLRAAGSFPTIIGPGCMSGKDIQGIDNMISTTIPLCKFDLATGDKRIFISMDYEHWFDTRKDIVIPVVEARGQMYYQRR